MTTLTQAMELAFPSASAALMGSPAPLCPGRCLVLSAAPTIHLGQTLPGLCHLPSEGTQYWTLPILSLSFETGELVFISVGYHVRAAQI